MAVYLISGPIASGKGVLTDYLRELNKDSELFVLSDILRLEAETKNIPITRDTLQTIGNELRLKEGSGVLGARALPFIKSAEHEKKSVIIDSIRNPAEVEIIKQNFPEALLIFVEAPLETRLKRAEKRGRIDDRVMENLKEILNKELERNPLGFDLPVLKERADIVVNGELASELMKEKFLEHLRELGIIKEQQETKISLR